MSDAHRFARHLVLAEIGPVGQRKIQDISVSEPTTASGRIAADYLRRAGARVGDDAGSNVIPLASPVGPPQTRIAVDAVHGALGALEVIRRSVGLPPSDPLGLS